MKGWCSHRIRKWERWGAPSYFRIYDFSSVCMMTISTRERAGFRDNVMGITATKISAGVDTGTGSHSDDETSSGDNSVWNSWWKDPLMKSVALMNTACSRLWTIMCTFKNVTNRHLTDRPLYEQLKIVFAISKPDVVILRERYFEDEYRELAYKVKLLCDLYSCKADCEQVL